MVLEQLRLDGPPRRVVIVTGGSRGLGKAMAISLAEAGADVCIASRTVSQLESAAGEIERACGRKPLMVPTNVQSSKECDALIEATVRHFGRLDVMVNNAGIGDRRGAGDRVQDLSDEDWLDTMGSESVQHVLLLPGCGSSTAVAGRWWSHPQRCQRHGDALLAAVHGIRSGKSRSDIADEESCRTTHRREYPRELHRARVCLAAARAG